MPEFKVGDRVYIDDDRSMMGTVRHLETQQQLSGKMQLFAHVQFDHLLHDPAAPGLLLPCEPRCLSHDLPITMGQADVERWLAS